MYRSSAPLRIGLAGGGTDVSPYCDRYGGAILNATIALFARAGIEKTNDNRILIEALDRKESFSSVCADTLSTEGSLRLHKGVYNRIVRQYGNIAHGFHLSTYVEAPAGSGLGTSSTLTVAIIGAFAEMLKLPLGESDIAQMAYEVEREDLAMSGGKQDQYAATFGGVNFMEFYENNRVIVNPLRIKEEYLLELQNNLLLFYTASSRLSSEIIAVQSQNVINENTISIEAMHQLKEQAAMMKEALLKGNIDDVGHILDFGFRFKKQMAEGISNTGLDNIYNLAKRSGATGGKISGAGGGGFMMFYCPGNTKYQVMEALSGIAGEVRPYTFTDYGLKTWSSKTA